MPKVLSAVRALLFGSAGSQAVALGVSGDTDPRLRIDAGGRLTWGTGSAAGDIYVERSGVNSLLVSGELLADSYAVDTTATPTGDVGKLIWNDTEGTLDLGLKGGNVTLPVGQAVAQRVTNTTGSNMTRGQVVRLAGSQGNRTTVALAQANNEAGSSKTFGVTTEAINDNQSGFVVTEGLIKDLNTSSLTEGAIVWLSPSTAGGLTTTKPSAPDHGVMVGLCVRSHASVGILLVKVQNGYELDELHNVSIDSPTDGQVLTYDEALALWKNANATGGGGGASVSVGDSAPASPSAGDLWFNSSNLKTYIYYDSFWVEVGSNAGGGGGAYTVTDVAPSTPNTGDVWYDSSTGRQYIYYDSYWVEMAVAGALTVSSHGTTHIRGGSDVIDGDQLQVDYVPSAYTRDTTSAGAGAATDLTAHLGGIDDYLISASSGRNRIVNGGMLVDQRYSGASQTARTGSRFPVVDRFYGWANGGGSIDTVRFSSSTVPDYGSTQALRVTVNTTDSSLGSSDLYAIGHEAEGWSLSGLGFGLTSGPVTLSFYVYSSVTGTFSVTLGDGVPVANRYYTASYTINAANTWERKSVTFTPSAVSSANGVWDSTGLNLGIYWVLAAGSGYVNSYPNTWYNSGGTPTLAVAGQTNFMANAGATFRLTGVQLEAGSAATRFEQRQYIDELRACQRYYYRINSNGNGSRIAAGQAYSTTASDFPVPLPTMRVVPTSMDQTSNVADYGVTNASGGGLAPSSAPVYTAASASSNACAYVTVNVASGLTAGNATQFYFRSSNGYLGFSAEGL